MNITIKELLKNEPTKFEYILNGNVGMDNIISYITIMDIPTITKWLKSQELLISGVFLEESFNAEFINELAEKKCAGIVTKSKFTKKLDPQLVDLCTYFNLPIIIVPDYYSWAEIMNSTNLTIVKKYYENIDSMNRFHNQLIKSAVSNDSLDKLGDSIISALDIDLAILSNSLIPISVSENFNWTDDFYSINLKELKETVISFSTDREPIYGKILIMKNNPEYKYFLIPLGENSQLGYLLIQKNSDVNLIPSHEIVKIQFSGLIYSLRASLKREIYNSIKSNNSLILLDIINSKTIDEDIIKKYSRSLSKEIHSKYTIIILNINSKLILKKDIYNAFMSNINSPLIKEEPPLNEVLIFEHKNNIVLFIPDILSLDLNEYMDIIFKKVNKFFNDDNYFGIGKTHDFTDIKLAFKEAQQALNFAIQNDIQDKIVDYESLDLIRFFTDNHGNLNYTFYDELIRKYLNPIIEYDNLNNTELFKTLETFFENNQSKKKTYEKLFIHKNTLIARLKSIEKILDLKLLGDTLFNIQLAVKIKKLTSEQKNL